MPHPLVHFACIRKAVTSSYFSLIYIHELDVSNNIVTVGLCHASHVMVTPRRVDRDHGGTLGV